MVVKDLLPAATELTISTPPENGTVAILNDMMASLDLRWLWKPPLNAGLAIARENVWSRAARRKQQRADAMQTDESGAEAEDEKVALAVKITADKDAIQLRWLRGSDYILFESFAGMLKRTLRESST